MTELFYVTLPFLLVGLFLLIAGIFKIGGCEL